MMQGSNLQSSPQGDVPVADKRYKVVRHSDLGMALIPVVGDYLSGSVGDVVLLLRWDREAVMRIVGLAVVETGIVGWSWAGVGRLMKSDSRFLVKVVEEVQIPGERGTAVLRVNRRRKFLALEDDHMWIGDDGAGIGRVPKVVVVLAAAGMAGESGCVGLVTEMFADKAARDLRHKDLGQRVEGCVNLQKQSVIESY